MINQNGLCMSCGVCAVSCAVDAIKIELSEDGFFKPVIDESKCVNCHICEQICPVTNYTYNDLLGGFSYKSKNKDSLSDCASGGFAFDSSAYLINDYNVCSVFYNPENNRSEHRVNKTYDDLLACRNSIYLQSYTVDGFAEILKLKKGVVIGTPCQISAINNYLVKKNLRQNYILIDFFCHGTPSYNLWKKYLSDKTVSFIENPGAVFRSKKNGWGRFTISLFDKNQSLYFDSIDNNDIFFKMFLENIVLNETCYDCKYHSTNCCADIRMGDLWGNKYSDDKEGVSGLLAFSLEGLRIIKELNEYGRAIEEETSDIIEGQLNEDIKKPFIRERMLKELQSDKDLKTINSTTFFVYKVLRRLLKIQ